MYMATVTAPTNIAVVKYWGKASVKYNTPTNSSVSVTLDQSDLRAVTTIATSPSFTQDRLWLNGEEEEGAADSKRFRACVDGVKALATDKKDKNGDVIVTVDDWKTWKVHVSSYNTFPTAAGLASSAAGYAALVAALTELYQAKETFPHELTTIARQGSGSACRSLYGGFVAWRQGTEATGWKDSLAEPVGEGTLAASEKHWPELRAVILVVSAQKKHTSSTAGMQTSVATSPFLTYRSAQVVPQRMKEMEQAWIDKDFSKFATLTMKDSNSFHSTCLDTFPPIFYLNDISRDIIRLTTAYNEYYGELRVAYTFDAGPNAVLYSTEPFLQELVLLVSHFFPEHGENYLRGIKVDTSTSTLDPAVLKHCVDAMPESYEVKPPTENVQYMYVTKAGPGPKVLLPSSLASSVAADA
eukprot:CAMPEP_0198144232 /NCGR_PEP_ID=MMETSP1443-20131203/14324_1 /TAXON_ID=186043 /ORGANISM="Entomoneis sp., Strain CCMP2396" /LENGTH=412 /DNA_ID=CAMNT_0043807591 /DNA_START=99 /DNA_END=1334 /DNA_ORIENTATION=-